LLVLTLASPAQAQFGRRAALRDPLAGPPPGTPPAEAQIWPFPPPDPKSWWDEDRPKPAEAADPLGGRRAYRDEHAPRIDNGIDPSTYRLWGLAPLQWQLVRDDEMILEVWTRPSLSVRQSVIRIVVRRDGKAFVQARAGLGCCEAGIGRRIGFDAELPAGAAAAFSTLRADPLWDAPRAVWTSEGPDMAGVVCVDGVAFDLTLVTAGRARSVRRACDPAEVGQAADVLKAAVGAALGHDGRFDVLYPGGADFSVQRSAYQRLLKSGGRLKAAPDAPPPATAGAPG
jgi:hypothetical protein